MRSSAASVRLCPVLGYARKADVGAGLGIRIYNAVRGNRPQREPLQLPQARAWMRKSARLARPARLSRRERRASAWMSTTKNILATSDRIRLRELTGIPAGSRWSPGNASGSFHRTNRHRRQEIFRRKKFSQRSLDPGQDVAFGHRCARDSAQTSSQVCKSRPDRFGEASVFWTGSSAAASYSERCNRSTPVWTKTKQLDFMPRKLKVYRRASNTPRLYRTATHPI